MKFSGRAQEVLLEDFRRELVENQSPIARRVYILAKI